jgi:glycosyltransferase involved in cell wall biosynthesis/GT2 family glycosyltransferase
MSDPAGAPGMSPRKGLRICLVTPDINGPVRNGGIGTACEAIARIAAEAGHDVTILYSRDDYTETAPLAEWVAFYAARGITLVPCPPARRPLEQFTDAILAWNVWRWLKGRSFDVIYLVDNMGAGFFVAMARFFGLAFQHTCLVAGAHAPTMWHLEGNRQLLTGRSLMGTDYMERMTIEHADAVVSPSRYMVEWMQRERWNLPQRVEVVPNPVPFHARPDALPRQGSVAMSELVFFGRLEPRKGIVLFARAVSMLSAEQLTGIRVTFLGKRTNLDADRLARSMLPGTVAWRIIDDMAASDAVAYVKQPGRVAVIASLMENAPMTVVECLGQGIPFIASAVGGIPELLHDDDRGQHLFRPNPPDLARVLSRCIAEGIGPARPAAGPARIDAIWRDMLPDLAGPHATRRESRDELGSASHPPDLDVPTARAQPDISVVLVHRNRPLLLQQAIHGLKQQTFTNFEVILVDDGSTKPEAIAALDRLDPEFRERGWRVIRQENRYLGAARNTGWRAARAPYVLFHDDDNICMPHNLATMLGAARRSGADVLTSPLAGFHGESEPDPDWENSADAIWAPLGGCQPLGLYENCFGDAHALVLRTVLEELGGFSEDFGTGHEDWELFARAALGGYKVWSVPEPLFWYRIDESSMLRSRIEPDADALRSARPYLALLDTPMRQALLCALSSEQMSERLQKAPPAEAITRSVGQMLTSVSQSRSIRVWRAARRLGLGGGGIPPESDLSPSGDPDRDFQRLLAMTGSVWWDLGAPMRLLGRLLRWRRSDV